MSRFLQEAERVTAGEYDDDHVCVFTNKTRRVKIECENCIDRVLHHESGKIYDCRCYEKEITEKVCIKCDVLKQTIQMCQEEIDILFLVEGQKIRTMCMCDEDAFKKIPELVRKMRHCQRVLLQKL